MSDRDWYVRLRGQGRVIFVDQATVGRSHPNRWTTRRLKLDASGGWKMRNDSGQLVVATDADIQHVLSNLKDLWINGEFAKGNDTCCLDNVGFGVDPTSTTSAGDAVAPSSRIVESPAHPSTFKPSVAPEQGVVHERTDRFRPLFNGKDITGWTAWGRQGRLSKADAAAIWWVRNGVLHGTGGGFPPLQPARRLQGLPRSPRPRSTTAATRVSSSASPRGQMIGRAMKLRSTARTATRTRPAHSTAYPSRRFKLARAPYPPTPGSA